MIVRGIVVTFIFLIFLFMPSVSSSFWILTDLAALVYLTVYLIMFSAAIKLRHSEPNTPRPYKVPGGKTGMWFFAGLGIFACLAAMTLGLVPPPAQLPTGSLLFYESFLIIGFLVILFIPFIIFRLRKPSWKKNVE